MDSNWGGIFGWGSGIHTTLTTFELANMKVAMWGPPGYMPTTKLEDWKVSLLIRDRPFEGPYGNSIQWGPFIKFKSLKISHRVC